MKTFFTKYQDILIKAGIFGFLFFFLKYMLPMILPFVIAFILVMLLYPLIMKVHRKTKMGKGLLAGGILLISGALLAVLLFFLSRELLSFVETLVKEFPDMESLHYLYSVLVQEQKELAPAILGKSVEYVSGGVKFFAEIAVMFIAVVLFAKDYDKIWKVIVKQPYCRPLFELIWKVVRFVSIYGRAQLTIMGIVFLISGTGFWINQYHHPYFLGFLTSFLDLLPFIGSGILLIPLLFYELWKENYTGAVVFLIAYGLCSVVRQYLEPKLIGERLEIYPVFILFSVYTGIKLFGIEGIFIGPFLALMIMKRD